MPATPIGDIVIRAIPMPADTNANGDIFGGWLMSQMDLGGAVVARRAAGSRVVTVAVNAMTFVAPVNVGDMVTFYGRLLGVGRTSLRVAVEAWVERYVDGEQLRVTHGTFAYVAIDDAGRKRVIGEGSTV